MNRPEPSSIIQDETESVGEILTKDELAKRWKISIKTVERLARDRVRGVRSFKIRRQVRFRLQNIEEFEKKSLTRMRAF